MGRIARTTGQTHEWYWKSSRTHNGQLRSETWFGFSTCRPVQMTDAWWSASERERANMVSAARAYLLEGVAKRIALWLIASAREWDGYSADRVDNNRERVESAIEPNAQTRWEDGTGSTASRPKRNRGNVGQARLVMVEKISTDRRSLARERWQRKQRTLDGVPKFDDGNSKRPTKIKKKISANLARFPWWISKFRRYLRT